MPATIGKPAPNFAAKAVMPDGSFKDVKLSDYKGARVAPRRLEEGDTGALACARAC